MSAQGRVEKSFFNVITGLFGQMLSFVLSFVIRMVFVKTLGEEYLGLNGLFTNILSVLNLTELGLGTAIVIELYKTVALNDTEKSKQYLAFYKKAYLIIGSVIFVAGMSLVPFLHHFIKDVETLGDINYRLIFILYIINTVFSYFFFAYRECIVAANQQEYRYRIITYCFKFVEMILQIIMLFLFKNIYLYLAIPIVLGCIQTIVKGILAGKWYPFILEKPKEKLTRDELKNTGRNIYSVALYKVSGTVMNSTDNIILSSFISILLTGLYSNYIIVTSALKTILSKVFNAFTASLGNLNVDAGEDYEKKYLVFRTLSFLNFWAYGYVAVCLFVLFTPFITFWLGKEFVLNFITELFIALNFLVFGLQETIGVHRSAYGLYYKGRFRPVFTVVLNIGLSILFVKLLPSQYGVAGVLLGTILSNLLVSWWYDAYIVHKYAFNKSPRRYYVEFWLRMIYVCSFGAALKFVSYLIPFDGIISFLLNGIICTVVYNLVFILLFRKKEEFLYFWSAVERLLKKYKKAK